MPDRNKEKYCVIVPAYQEEGRIGKVVEGIRIYCEHVVVVDDGSSDGTSDEARRAGALVIRHDVNMGKGVALNSGFRHAREHKFDFLITMDADGQHDPSDIPGFTKEYFASGTPVLVGNRMDDPKNMPLVRRLTNRFMSWLLSRNMGQCVPDSQCGFRLFRCDVIPEISRETERYAAESEILLRLAERGTRIGAVPVKVIYGGEKSKINPVTDTVRFFGMLGRHRRERG